MKKIIVLALIVLTNLITGCTVEQHTEKDPLPVTDPRFTELYKSVAQLTYNVGLYTYYGTGYFFDHSNLDGEDTKLYMMTNAHVVVKLPTNGFVSVKPSHELSTLPKLCGKVVWYEYENLPLRENNNIDLAIIEITAEDTSSDGRCTQTRELNFASYLEDIKFLNVVADNYDINSAKNDYFLTVGYPQYNTRTVTKYTNTDPRKSFTFIRQMKEQFNSDCNTSTNKCDYAWNYDIMLFNGNTMGGASGSPIVDANMNLVATLAFGDNSGARVGAVSYKSMNNVLVKFCADNKYQTLEHC